ncbi:hypothetical protein [Curtobacterium sp. 1544]|uniref:hypothetical protein n=1 Tax=Curtobacterium sp. 1544 TaxID=3156417 RepID=UPI0033995097
MDAESQPSVLVSAGHIELSNDAQSLGIDTSDSGGAPSVAVVDDGAGVSITNTITSEEDSRVSYSVELPAGVSATTVPNDDGVASVIFTTPEGELAGGVASVDAVDANGKSVATSVHVEGTEVVQQLDAEPGAVAFPVQVRAAASTVWYKRAWVGTAKKGYIVNADPTSLGRQQIAWTTHKYHVQHVKNLLGSTKTKKYWNWNIEQQFVCHVVGAYFPSGVYNMESWQPALAWGAIANPIDRCNRTK